jgi:hypothetical protein
MSTVSLSSVTVKSIAGLNRDAIARAALAGHYPRIRSRVCFDHGYSKGGRWHSADPASLTLADYKLTIGKWTEGALREVMESEPRPDAGPIQPDAESANDFNASTDGRRFQAWAQAVEAVRDVQRLVNGEAPFDQLTREEREEQLAALGLADPLDRLVADFNRVIAGPRLVTDEPSPAERAEIEDREEVYAREATMAAEVDNDWDGLS